MTTVTIADLRAVTFCARGARAFAIRHNLDWSDFLKNGVDASKIEHIDDEMVRQVIRAAILREMRQEAQSE